jgi:hypothetical protein
MRKPRPTPSPWGLHPLAEDIPIWVPKSGTPIYYENTCRVLPPAQGPSGGLIVVLPGQGSGQFLQKIITRRIYDAGGNVDLDPASSVEADLPNPGYLDAHTDNQLVRAKDGSFLAMKACFNWSPLPNPQPWQQICVPENRMPYTGRIGGRGTNVIWRGHWTQVFGGGWLGWNMQGYTDPFTLAGGIYSFPRPLSCPDPDNPIGAVVFKLSDQCQDSNPPFWMSADRVAECEQLRQQVQDIDGQISDLGDPEQIKYSTALTGKRSALEQKKAQVLHQEAVLGCDLQGYWAGPGSDRPEMYACPFTGYLYLTATFRSGPFASPQSGTEPFRSDTRVLYSVDQGASWQMLDVGGSPLSGPLVMTSTPNGRLFLYLWGRENSQFYGRLLCSDLFDYENKATPKIAEVVSGRAVIVAGQGYGLTYGPVPLTSPPAVLQYGDVTDWAPSQLIPPDPTMKDNDETIYHPSISRVSTDGLSSRVRVSLLALNAHARNIYAIVDIGVTDQGGQLVLEPNSLRLAGRVEARDPANYSVLHGTFIDPDYVSMPPGVVSDASLFYWLEWPRGRGESLEWTLPEDMCVRGCLFDGSPSSRSNVVPLSVANGTLRTWKGRAPGGDYMSGGFFYDDGFYYLPQWTEPEGIRGNLVHFVPPPTIPITKVPP